MTKLILTSFVIMLGALAFAQTASPATPKSPNSPNTAVPSTANSPAADGNTGPAPLGSTPTIPAASSVAGPIDKDEVAKPSDLLNGIIEDYTYTPQGKRDPFAPYDIGAGDANALGPLFPLQKYDLDQLHLVGIIWEVRHPKAMIMDPTGTSHVVKVNDRVGRNNGYVARIREGEVVIVESYKENRKTNYQTQVMKLGTQ